MSNFDKIDDYLTGKLRGEERAGFEQQLGSDPTLRSEVELQRTIVEAIKKSRASEIKQMLNRVEIAPVAQYDFSILRMAAGLAGAGVLAASLYFYFKPEIHLEDASTDILKKTEKIAPAVTNPETISTDSAATAPANVPETKKEKETPKSKATSSIPASPKAIQKPTLEVLDPSNELAESMMSHDRPNQGAKLEPVKEAQVSVDVDSSDKKYDFHYQFVNKKLMLFGSFDKTLYEVIEVNGVSQSLFLFYKNMFYNLEVSQSQITPLTPIKDQALLAKLSEFRK